MTHICLYNLIYFFYFITIFKCYNPDVIIMGRLKDISREEISRHTEKRIKELHERMRNFKVKRTRNPRY